MSFLAMPTNYRMDVPPLSWDVFWYDQWNHLRLIRWGNDSLSPECCIVHTDHLTPALLVDAYELDLQAGLVNGYPHWSDGTRHVFMSMDGNWILHTALAEPRAYQLSNDGDWKGDGWWKLSNFYPSDIDTNPTLDAKGLYLNEADAPATPPVVSWYWPRWIRDATESGASAAPFGVYVATNEASMSPPRRTVGCMRFRHGSSGGYWVESLDGNTFVRSYRGTTQTLAEKAGGIWATNGWSATAAGSWFQASSRPTREGGAILTPMKRDEAGEPPHTDGDSVELSFVDFVSSNETETIFLAEVALWR